MQDIRKASSSLYKINKKLKACDIIDKEITVNKTAGGISQTSTKNFETFLKIRKQSLIAKANETIPFSISRQTMYF
ncbi:MAG: hypothetical protein ABJB76_11645 [Candidatus Nitrosocosmicus sp.]